ncbi:hypothetical protein Ccrd_017069 [Cynara cardunculus var. scolymus]|uniref:Uncharacterized protein n=1 Tax=Cynara cardunculus var. scolymus TaxID=59895 RepID=A0A103Y8S2_CYNCS|nr:hypothetical protein Ccrd_017069 [Cynara cardunculus var. scolymus]
METAGVSVDTTNSDHLAPSNPLSPSTRTTSSTSSSSFPVIRFLQAPVTTVLEYSGVFRPRSNNDYPESESLIPNHHHHHDHDIRSSSDSDTATSSNGDNGEVSIRIIGAANPEEQHGREDGEPAGAAMNGGDGGRGEREMADSSDVDGGNGGSGSHSDSSYQQRYDMQQVSRWIEQILPFSLLLLIVFIRQHLQGFFVTIYVTTFMYKSNDILRKQTALKGERRLSVLADTMVQQAAMAFKLVLLMYYRNGKGHNFRRQVGSFWTALKALSRKEVHYGSYATPEQVRKRENVSPMQGFGETSGFTVIWGRINKPLLPVVLNSPSFLKTHPFNRITVKEKESWA